MLRTSQGRKIGKYVILGVLGHGGMGSVYKALDPTSERIVALKQLNFSGPLAEILDRGTLRELFRAEATAMSQLHHQNIIEILDTVCDGNRPYYTMEFFCNNLGAMIGEHYAVDKPSRIVAPEQAITYGTQILAGLECLHKKKIIHRDIKPYNMMITDNNNIKICDFGMARQNNGEPVISEEINIGSPYYSAPEQIRAPESADVRSDLFSAGVLIYRMITGELPGMKGFMLSRVNPLYDQTWDKFFARALSWNPELRFQSSREMSLELIRLTLHWEKNRTKACRRVLPGGNTDQPSVIRSEAVRCSGTKARQIFGVNELWQPETLEERKLHVDGDTTFLDASTKLIWQRSASEIPLDRLSADDFIDSLNEICFGGIEFWRLPTVNELLSLLAFPRQPECNRIKNDPLENGDWYWSCDRRSANSSWFVNLKIRYVGWQDDNCPYQVRAVATVKK